VTYVWHGQDNSPRLRTGLGEELVMWRWLKQSVLAALHIFAVAQVFRPARTNPPIDPEREIGATLSMDPKVGSV
jgi:hypothetical protein